MAVTEHWLKKSLKGQGSQGETWWFGLNITIAWRYILIAHLAHSEGDNCLSVTEEMLLRSSSFNRIKAIICKDLLISWLNTVFH